MCGPRRKEVVLQEGQEVIEVIELIGSMKYNPTSGGMSAYLLKSNAEFYLER